MQKKNSKNVDQKNGKKSGPNSQNYFIFIIKIAPLILLPAAFLSLYYWRTARITYWMLQEGYPIEVATFIFLLGGGILGLILALKMRQTANTIDFLFYIFFSVLMTLTAMEEVAWGQLIFNFETPAFWNNINFQHETTLHNIKGLQHHSEIFRFIFGLGGLFGIWLSRFPNFRKIVPHRVLLTWFLVIFFHAGIDVYNDYFPIARDFDFKLSRTAELVEMMIGASGFLYIVLNWKKALGDTGKPLKNI